MKSKKTGPGNEDITKTLFKISNAVNTTDNLNDLYKSIHKSLNSIIDATNFYIALYDKNNDVITFPYNVDVLDGELEDIKNASKSKSSTNEVIHKGKPIFLRKKEMLAKVKVRNVGRATTPAELWLGVPLRIKRGVIGAIVIQSYNDPNIYGPKDMDLLISVSDQVALAINRKLSEDAQKKSDKINKALFSISNAVNTTTNLDDLFESIHKTLNKIMDLSNFFIAIYNKKKDCVTFPYSLDEKDSWDPDFIIENASMPNSPSLTTWIIQSGESVLFSKEDLIAHMKKFRKEIPGTPPAIWMGSPLKVHNKVIGVIATQNYNDPNIFNKRDLEIFNSVSDQIALAIERKRAQEAEAENKKINKALFTISNAANTSENLDELYKSIHKALGDIIDVNNFMIGIYDGRQDIISYPYFQDEADDDFNDIKNVSKSGIVSWEVINLKKPFFINRNEVIARAKRIGIDIRGKIAEQWLGIPLKIKRKVIGVIVVQSYSDPDLYSQKDVEILLSVSEQVAMAIDLKKAEEERKKNELYNKTLFEISNAVNTTQSLAQLCSAIDTLLKKVIFINNFSLALYDKETDRLTFLYRADSTDLIDCIENASKSSSLTYEIIRRGEYLLLDAKGQEQLIKKLGGHTFGIISKSWLCVPLKIRNETIGAILTQDYKINNCYKEKDIELLTLVSGQIALSIERKRSEEALKESRQQIKNISDQTEQFSLAAASMISTQDPKETFRKISRAIVKFSNYNRVAISYLIDKTPYHEILAYEGLHPKSIAKYRKVTIKPGFLDNFFKKGEHIGQFSVFIQSYELKKAYNANLTKRDSQINDDTHSAEWHPDDMLFIKMLGLSGNLIGFISVDDPKSLSKPTDETVRPLETFSNLASQIIIYTKSQEELKIAKNAAEASAKSKSEFLANMSHEIRTPMNAIMGLTELTLKTDLDEKQKDYLNKLKSSSTSLLGIINDILDFSKIDAGKMDIESIDFRLDDVMESLSDMFSTKTAEKEVEFVISIANDIPINLIGDPLRLRQALINLTGNAVKFTEKGEIVVSVTAIRNTDKHVRLEFSIKDTGIGIPEERLNKLFDSFVQADGSTTRKYGGTGLGLSISKNLIELMGGSIDVKSKLGQGTLFSFQLTFAKRNTKAINSKQLSAELKNMKVLVVDDNRAARDILHETLASFQFDVKAVESGDKAIEELLKASMEKSPFKLVILDLIMPGIDGIDTAKFIRSSSKISKTPIIMMTAFGREEVIHQAERAGVNAFLMKPVKNSVLLDTIMDVFGKKPGNYATEAEDPENIEKDLSLLEGLNVLLVEDNNINQLVARRILENAKILVDIASTGVQAVEQLSKKKFDVVLMDIQMPEMDGYTATQEIRNKLKLTDLPIIAMTAHAMTGDKDKCLDAGMNDYLSKPIDSALLYTKLIQYGPKRKSTNTKKTKKASQKELLPDIPKSIPGINIEAGLSRFMGDTEVYLKLLEDFMNDYKNSMEKIESMLAKKEIEDVLNYLHAIKGIAGNLSVDKLYKSSTELESFIEKNSKADKPLLKNYKEAFNEASKSFEKLNNLFMDFKNQNNKSPAKGYKDKDIADKIQLLYTKILDNDLEALDALNIVKNMIEAKIEAREIAILDKAINNFDFDEAKIVLFRIADILNVTLTGV